MSALSRNVPVRRSVTARRDGVRLLQAFVVIVTCIPSDIVIRPIGAVGYPAGLLAMAMFALWVLATSLGLHDAGARRHPIRGALCLLWLSALVSYVAMDRGSLTAAQLAASDRFLMQLGVISGVALVAAEGLTSIEDVRDVLRWLTYGGAFCGAVAALQFWLRIDVTPVLRKLPGFTTNAVDTAISSRGAQNRVAGTAIHPIELGVAAGILLPLAIHVAIHDVNRSVKSRWLPVLLIALAIPASVSRSAILAVAIAMSVFVMLMPVRQRVLAFAAFPLALVGVFVSAHGLLGTLATYFGMGTSDASISHRVGNYPFVEQLVRQAPWLGHGGGTWIPQLTSGGVHILDNEYLKTAIELGLVGVVALAAFFLITALTALRARHATADPELRLLCAALAGGALAAGVCSAAFDSLSFPMFYNVAALVAGLAGACWRLTNDVRAKGG